MIAPAGPSRSGPRSAALAAVAALGALLLPLAPAGARPALPAQDGATEAICQPLEVSIGGHLRPGEELSVAIECPLVRAETSYVGAITTGPIPFPESLPLADGQIGFAGLVVPDGFETERFHRIALIEAQGGREVGAAHLYVNAAGQYQLADPPPAPTEGSGWRQALRDTGLVEGRADGLVKVGAVALAAAALRWRRRRAPRARPATS